MTWVQANPILTQGCLPKQARAPYAAWGSVYPSIGVMQLHRSSVNLHQKDDTSTWTEQLHSPLPMSRSTSLKPHLRGGKMSRSAIWTWEVNASRSFKNRHLLCPTCMYTCTYVNNANSRMRARTVHDRACRRDLNSQQLARLQSRGWLGLEFSAVCHTRQANNSGIWVAYMTVYSACT